MPPPSTTLCCRLLCACCCAYDIDPLSGRYQPPPADPYAKAVGYLAPPAPVSGAIARIDACLVGANADGVIVAFRGTVTGHSLGGAMASIGAYIMQAAPYRIGIEQVVTFASPNPGDGAFQTASQKVFPDQIRYERYDLVPLLPPADDMIRAAAHIPLIGDLLKQAESWDYQPVGTLRYIESAEDGYQVIPDRPLLMDERLVEIAAELARDVFEENFASFGDAHSCACGHGYMGGTCPAAVCTGAPTASAATPSKA